MSSSSSSDILDIDTSSQSEDSDAWVDEEETTDNTIGNEQWVNLIEFCSVNSKSDQAVTKDTGVKKLCHATNTSAGDPDTDNHGWIVTNNNRQESLVVSFEKPIFINEIIVYETLNPGGIVKLEMLDSARDVWLTMWQRRTLSTKHSASYHTFKPILRRYRIQSNTIRLTIDPTHTNQIGIQAIKLLGSNTFDAKFHQKSLSSSMSDLYEQAQKKLHTDVQFLVDNEIIHAHRNVLCFRSQYFRSLLLNDFVEKSQRKPIELTDITKSVFYIVLQFIYTGAYPADISYDTAMELLIYTNKITLVSAKNAAMEYLGHHLCMNHDLIITTYDFVKKTSPAFDSLLNYIYNLCADNLNEICRKEDFTKLDKDSMIDIICHSTEIREARAVEQATVTNTDNTNAAETDDDEAEEEE
ncbi:unnamed protein product [Adineta ricciae]|uniref:BTB domain-containing protein n=1 Tax=Adineta ricciae TaxID=249248 RepID=A0A815S2T7_ADIRI|nr:unnamed protein product [Adineta ricciae]